MNINEQGDGTWNVTTCNLEHSGHLISRQAYYSNTHVKKLNPEDLEYLKELKKVRALPRNMAEALSKRKGTHYKTGEIRYLIKQIEEVDKTDTPAVEKVLQDIHNNGGNVMFDKDSVTKNVDVLWIQTQKMRETIAKVKPCVFECDTTFNTQVEGFKLYIKVFHSNESDMWEVAGLLFLSSETKAKVEKGLGYFKMSLPYTTANAVSYTHLRAHETPEQRLLRDIQ